MAGFIPAIHVFTDPLQERRGWPGRARPWRATTQASGLWALEL